ncbi:hypothetical protein ACFP63_11295 [Oerskovia jenensis]|uniref:Multisubunit Na+/H+ antiporter MnhE subunit n=1 Tax=Oerskovia jenensis TaxID=162169 RepID=A0ABS2LLW0_9CELL|nr:hypothetical protein [Oerskovia jenensis]MBM7480869.1 multisubunit Na+/H+ antiporter MnhE subunit [Oerskovia jenensis]
MTNETDPGPGPDQHSRTPAGGSAQAPSSEGSATGATSEPTRVAEQGRAAAVGGNPFAGIPVSDYVRDGVAALLLFVSLTMPWDVGHKASDKVEVILVTVVSLLSLALPYLARTGALPTTWTVHTTRLARLVANAPYVLLAAVYIVLDLVNRTTDNGWGGVGTALSLGLAGAFLAAQPRQAELGPVEQDGAASRLWTLVLTVIAGVAVVGAVVAFLLTFSLGVSALLVLRFLVAGAVTVALVGWPVWGILRRDEAWRLVLVGLGIALVVLFVLNTSNLLVSFDSFALGQFGLLLVPAAAAVASSPALARTTSSSSPVSTWVAVAVHALDLVVVVALGTALTGVFTLADGGRGSVLILSIVFGLLAAGAALVARRSLARDAVAGRTLALGAAGVVAILGIVLLIVATNQPGAGFGTTLLLLAYGLPLVVVFALTVPAEVRTHFAENRPSSLVGADAAPSAYVWQPPAPRPARPKPAPEPVAGPYGSGSYATGPDGYGPEPGEHEPDQVAAPSRPTPVRAPARPDQAARPDQPVQAAQQPPSAQPVQQVRYQPSQEPTQPVRQDPQPARPVEQYQPTQVLPAQGGSSSHPVQPVVPERSGYAARPGYAAQPVGDTAVLPPYQDPQPAGFSAAQALDPSTPLEVLAQIVQEAPHLRPQVAANPSTYPALVEWLGNLGDPAVDAALRSRGR